MRAEGHSVCACDFEISYERMRWPAINIGGLRGDRFRVRVVICVVYLPCLTCRRCQKMERGLRCLWQKVTAKYFRIIRETIIYKLFWCGTVTESVIVIRLSYLRKLQNSKGSSNTQKQTGQTFYRVSLDSNLRVYLSMYSSALLGVLV